MATDHNAPAPGPSPDRAYTVVVNARRDSPPTALATLLESLKMAGVPPPRVVCGGAATGEPPPADVPVWVPVPGPSGPLVGLAHAGTATGWVVYLQDTMAVGFDFAARVGEVLRLVAESKDTVHCVRLSDRDCAGVGLYDAAWLAGVAIDPASADPDAVMDACPRATTKFLGRADADRRTLGEFRYDDAEAPRAIVWFPALDVYSFAPGPSAVHV